MNERGTWGGGSASPAHAGTQKGCSVIDSEGLLRRKVKWVWVRLGSF